MAFFRSERMIGLYFTLCLVRYNTLVKIRRRISERPRAGVDPLLDGLQPRASEYPTHLGRAVVSRGDTNSDGPRINVVKFYGRLVGGNRFCCKKKNDRSRRARNTMKCRVRGFTITRSRGCIRASVYVCAPNGVRRQGWVGQGVGGRSWSRGRKEHARAGGAF